MTWEKENQVSLGCGTLILIAIIVMIFSDNDTDDLEREIRALRSQVGELKQSIEAQSAQLRTLQEQLDRNPEQAEREAP